MSTTEDLEIQFAYIRRSLELFRKYAKDQDINKEEFFYEIVGVRNAVDMVLRRMSADLRSQWDQQVRDKSEALEGAKS